VIPPLLNLQRVYIQILRGVIDVTPTLKLLSCLLTLVSYPRDALSLAGHAQGCKSVPMLIGMCV
jgi:hypothetical protein